ncbi:hypothetical protein RB11228 [Rhodopirellula baltica SH 1]|uniref:Uncharacterized protein n=1 Tax=Rhodopirellula baltica (strain DSM 10527 / NCIMB 13988 / SH1) TaxID=243090 RepID=Q7UEN5_RHOBA|nr:hypothetical protein RB11228 [Rhodopirellula baltica SH 1]
MTKWPSHQPTRFHRRNCGRIPVVNRSWSIRLARQRHRFFLLW